MDMKKCFIQSLSKESAKPEVSPNLMRDDVPYIFRSSDVSAYKVHCTPVESPLGILGSIKRKFGRRIDDDPFRTMVPPTTKLGNILLKIFSR